MSKIITRFAPSPTGHLHIGGARTALFCWLLARHYGGEFRLRIEDTDTERSKQEYTDAILASMRWLGLDWDGELTYQTQRTDRYNEVIDKMIESGHAYWCSCTPEEVEAMREAARAKGEKPRYDGRCRERGLDAGPGRVVRLKIPTEGRVVFDDMVKGHIATDASELDDMILRRSDGMPTYNMAVVVDDHDMGITHVIRGDDHVSNTPKQILIYQALGWELPVFGHVPMILGKDRQKLSKRHGATSFEDLMADGYLPEAVTNYIALLGWCPKDNQEMFTLEGLAESFSIDGISKSPAVFDYDKLTWFNGEYIRGKSPEEFLQLAKPYFRQAFPDTEAPYPKLVEILQPRVTRLTQIPEMIGFFQKLPGYEKELFINKKSKTNLENSKEVLEDTIALLEALPNWNHDGIHDCLIQYAQEKGLKNGTVMWPVRIAAAGQLVTPGGAIEILEILGREESLRRLRLGLAKL